MNRIKKLMCFILVFCACSFIMAESNVWKQVDTDCFSIVIPCDWQLSSKNLKEYFVVDNEGAEAVHLDLRFNMELTIDSPCGYTNYGSFSK